MKKKKNEPPNPQLQRKPKFGPFETSFDWGQNNLNLIFAQFSKTMF